jgi:pyroglutamyl-peptidase
MVVPSVLLTAFQPYDRWTTNASQLAMEMLARDLPASPDVTTRILPVDFDAVKRLLADELVANYDYALHVGQAPGSTAIRLEAVALNVACDKTNQPHRPLCDDGPLAYRSTLPLHDWRDRIEDAGIPAEVSFHAGTFLCNAAMYLTQYFSEQLGLKTQAAFIHLPLDPSQITECEPRGACLSTAAAARAIQIVLEQLT